GSRAGEECPGIPDALVGAPVPARLSGRDGAALPRVVAWIVPSAAAMTNPSAPDVCEHPECKCPVGKQAVRSGGKSFCSEDCAEGLGCKHRECDCATPKA